MIPASFNITAAIAAAPSTSVITALRRMFFDIEAFSAEVYSETFTSVSLRSSFIICSSLFRLPSISSRISTS